MPTKDLESVLQALPEYENAARSIRDMLLANLVMIGEIPAPTFNERQRVEMVVQRFNEAGLQNCSADEMGNGAAVLPGATGERSILVSAHADGLFGEDRDHTVTVQSKTVKGLGLADNSLGLAALATLPTLLEKLDIRLDANLIMLADAQSLGRGNLGGIWFFLEKNQMPVCSALAIEGERLGRLSYASADMLRGEIRCQVPENIDRTPFGPKNAISVLSEVVRRIEAIPLPTQPPTQIVLGQIAGGASFNQYPTETSLRFEALSQQPGMTAEIGSKIEDICFELRSTYDVNIELERVADRQSGGLPFDHPLPTTCRKVLEAQGLRMRIRASISELSAFIGNDIPAVTLGLTEARNINTPRETLEIEPMFQGMAQLVAVLLAVDGGICVDN